MKGMDMSNTYSSDTQSPDSYPSVPPVGSEYTGYSGASDESDGPSGKADAAKEQASQVGQQAAGSAKQVAGVAKDEAVKVAGEAKTQAKDLFAQAKTQLSDQATNQQQRVATGIRSLGDELTSMADSSTGGGIAADLVSQVAGRTSSVAEWLEGRDPGSLLAEVKSFAARKPGTFIAIAAVAGVLAGRLTRSVAGVVADEKEADAAPASTDGPTFVSDPVTTGFEPTTTYGTVPADLYDTTVGTTGIDPTIDEVEPGYVGGEYTGTSRP